MAIARLLQRRSGPQPRRASASTRATSTSHCSSPAGFEIWEQLGYRAPAAIVASVGYGSQLLGLARAFASLRAGGAIDRLPRLFAAQTAAFPALTRAFDAGTDNVDAAQDGTTVAEGIACRLPARGPAMLAAIRESGVTAAPFFASRSAPDWQAVTCRIARGDAVSTGRVCARLYMEAQS